MKNQTRRLRQKHQGFSLIELMIAVLVAGILVAIAVPSYINQVRKSRRTEAKTSILDIAGREERYYNTNNAYTTIQANLGYGTATTAMSNYQVGNYYQVTIAASAAGTFPATFTVSAVPFTTDQLKDTQCLYFSVDNTGKQTASNSTSGTGTDTTASCW